MGFWCYRLICMKWLCCFRPWNRCILQCMLLLFLLKILRQRMCDPVVRLQHVCVSSHCLCSFGGLAAYSGLHFAPQQQQHSSCIMLRIGWACLS